MTWLLLVGLVAASFVSGATARCGSFDIQGCQESSDLKRYLFKQGIDITDKSDQEKNWLFSLDRTQLKTYCNDFRSYESCLKRNVYGCDEANAALIKGVNDAVNYLCKHSFEEYLRYQSCLSRDDVGSAIEICAKRSINQMQYEGTKEGICSDLKSGEDCEVTAVKTKCGKKAAKWFEKFIKKMSQPVKDYGNCDSMSTGLVVVIIVVLAISIKCCIAALCVCGRRAKAARRATPTPVILTNSTAADSVAPPPYSAMNHVFNSDKEKLVPV